MNMIPHNPSNLSRPEARTSGPVQETPTPIESRVYAITYCYGYMAVAVNALAAAAKNNPEPAEAAQVKEIFGTHPENAFAVGQAAAAAAAPTPAPQEVEDAKMWTNPELVDLANIRANVSAITSHPGFNPANDYSETIGMPTGMEAADASPTLTDNLIQGGFNPNDAPDQRMAA